MSYGPDGLAPKNLAGGYASGAIGTSVLAALGVMVLILTFTIGVLYIVDEDCLAIGLAWMGGGVALAVSLFGLAARQDRKYNLSSAPVWYLDKHNLAISLMLMLVGAWVFYVSRQFADDYILGMYTGALGVAVIIVALLWFSLSVRD